MITPDSLEQLRDEGAVTVPFDDITSIMERYDLARRAHRVPPFLRRPISDWERTKRATFFNNPRRFPYTLLDATVWVPEAVCTATMIQGCIAGAAREAELPEFNTFFNRIGIHYMKGTPEKPAIIPMHTDPVILNGVVAVVSVEGEGQRSECNTPGSLALIACADICEQFGIEQVAHEVVATEPRISYTFAHFG